MTALNLNPNLNPNLNLHRKADTPVRPKPSGQECPPYHRGALRSGILTIFCLLTLLTVAHAQTTTQTIQLSNGWNAVWLEVAPTNNSSDAVFSTLPVSSVWTRAERIGS